MEMETDISTEERVVQLMRHLGLEQAHFAAREFLEFDGLVRAHRAVIASLTLVLPPRTLNPETLRPLGTRLLCFYGGKGDNAEIMRRSLASLPLATTLRLEDYPDLLWADVIADRTEFIGNILVDFLARMDLQAGLRSAPLAPGEGEAAGIHYRILGSGPPLVLLPLALNGSRSWRASANVTAPSCSAVRNSAACANWKGAADRRDTGACSSVFSPRSSSGRGSASLKSAAVPGCSPASSPRLRLGKIP